MLWKVRHLCVGKFFGNVEEYPSLTLKTSKYDFHAADLGDDAANNAVERFAEANFSRINNKNGFLMVGACYELAVRKILATLF